MGDSDEDLNLNQSHTGDQYLLEEGDIAANSVSFEEDTCDIKIPSGLARNVVEQRASTSDQHHNLDSFKNQPQV